MRFVSPDGFILDENKVPVVENGQSLKIEGTTITPPPPPPPPPPPAPTVSSGDVVIKVKFNAIPTSATSSIPKLKYGKSSMIHMEVDDCPSDFIDWMALFQGGIASIHGGNEVMPGKTSTDGCGNNIKWTLATGVNVRAVYDDSFYLEDDSRAFAGNHIPASYFPSMVANGFLPIPHGYYHQDFGTIHNPPSQPDYYVANNFNKSLNVSECIKYIWQKSGGFCPRYFIVPQDSTNYNVECKQQWLLGQSSETVADNEPQFPNEGEQWVNNNSFVDDVIALNGNYGAFLRFFFYNWTDASIISSAKSQAGYVAANGTVNNPQFRRFATHAFSSGEWAAVKDFVNHIATTGGDKVWVTTLQEFLEYLEMRRLITKTETLVGDTLTIRLNYSNIPNANLWRDLSLMIQSDKTIQSISVSNAQGYSYNTTTGLINVFNKRKVASYPWVQQVTGQFPINVNDSVFDNSQQDTPAKLTDQNDSVGDANYTPATPVILAPDIIYDIEKYRGTVSSVIMKCTLGAPNTVNVYAKRADTGALVSLGTFTGTSTTQTFTHAGTYNVSQIVLRSAANGSFGSEIYVFGKFMPLLPNPYKKPRRPIGYLLGANGHVWDLMNDAKLNAIKTLGIKSLRVYDYGDFIRDQNDNWDLNAFQGVGRYSLEQALSILKTFDPTMQKWRAVNRQFPSQTATWHVGSNTLYLTATVQSYNDFTSFGTGIIHIDSVTGTPHNFYSWWEVRKNGVKINFTNTILNLDPSAVGTTPNVGLGGGLGLQAGDVLTFHKSQDSTLMFDFPDYNNRRVYVTYRKIGNTAYIIASRDGRNTSVPDYPVVSGAAILKGLGLNEWVEIENEPDAWWAGLDNFLNGEDLYYQWAMAYDGNMGQYPDCGAKNADPTMLVSTSGIATDKLDRITGAWYKARELRGLNPDGSVNTPWDIVQMHIYSSAGGQYGGSTAGGLPPEQGMFPQVRKMVGYIEEKDQSSIIDIGEHGWDQNSNSILRAGIVGALGRETVAASWAVRGWMGFAALGLDKAQYYRLFEDWPESTTVNNSTQFATMRLLSQPIDNDVNTIVRSRQGDYMKQLSEFSDYVIDTIISDGVGGIYCYQFKNGLNTIIALWSEEQTTIVSNAPSFTERTGNFNLPVPNNASLKIRTFVDDGSGIMASSNATATGTTYSLAYGTKPKIVQINLAGITPSAPTAGVVNNTNKSFDFTYTPGYTTPDKYEYSINGGAYVTATKKPISVGNVSILVGQLKVRVKAIGADTPSSDLTNATAYTATTNTFIGRQLVDKFTLDTQSAIANALTWLPTTYDTDPANTTYPLIVFFHGVGEAGNGTTDLSRLINTGLPQIIANGYNAEAVSPITGLNTKFIVVSPQHSYFSWGADGTFYLLPYMLDSIIAKYRVDITRIYYVGLSAGAQGVLTAVTNDSVFAQRIAAICPVSFTGWNSPSEQTNTALVGGTYHVPMWAAVGTAETYYSRAVDLKTRYNSVSPVPAGVIDEKPGATHSPTVWNSFFDPAVWPTDITNSKGISAEAWLLSNHR